MRIRRFSNEDLAAIMSIQSKTPQAAQWTQADYASLAADPLGLILVAELDTVTPPMIVGFGAFHCVIDEADRVQSRFIWKCAPPISQPNGSTIPQGSACAIGGGITTTIREKMGWCWC